MAGREDGGRRTAADGADGSRWAEELLDHLRPHGRDVRRVVAWLADSVQGVVLLQDDGGRLLAGTRAPLDQDLVAAVAAGRIASAAWDARDRHVRLVRVRYPNRAAAGVLAVSREAPFDRRTFDIVTHTVQVIELLLTADETTAAGARLEQATSDLRLAILQLLMVEDTVSARRVAAGLWPGLLDADTACVHVVEGAVEERDAVAEECLEVTGERALVVLCPAVEEHVIVVTPGEGEARRLRSMIGERPRTFIGGSVRQSLARTATAYGQAVSALAVAHFRPDKAAVYAERTHPEGLIDPVALREWTDRLLRPLAALAHHTRAELLATTRLGLEFTAVSTAKILGVSRNTVRARMERVETLLDADFANLTARAVVHFALNLHVSFADAPAVTENAGRDPVPLVELLSGPAVCTWARNLLDPLDQDARDLRRTLRTWIAEDGNAERAAHTLGVHPQTVREHVRSAEPVLERRLLAGGSDLYEVVLAHLTPEGGRRSTLLGAKTGLPDSLVHG